MWASRRPRGVSLGGDAVFDEDVVEDAVDVDAGGRKVAADADVVVDVAAAVVAVTWVST